MELHYLSRILCHFHYKGYVQPSVNEERSPGIKNIICVMSLEHSKE